jgi:taurine dioxygenase
MAMQINKLGEHLGAEITGIDLREPQDDATVAALNKALSDYVAIVVRDQDFTPAEYVEAAKVFGEAFPQNFEDYNHPDAPLINIVSNKWKDENGKMLRRADQWHTDHTNHECPPKCTVLYAVELPDEGGPTAICNMQKVYEHLPQHLKDKIDGRETVNVNQGRAAIRSSPKALKREAQEKSIPINHPLVRTHPENGGKAIFFHPIKTDYVTGYTPEETRELLVDLMIEGIKEEYVYYHRWKPGDMLLWDNRQAMHRAVHDYDPNQRRELYRLLIEGDRPF